MTYAAIILIIVFIIFADKIFDPKRIRARARGKARVISRYEDYFIDSDGTINYHKKIDYKG